MPVELLIPLGYGMDHGYYLGVDANGDKACLPDFLSDGK